MQDHLFLEIREVWSLDVRSALWHAVEPALQLGGGGLWPRECGPRRRMGISHLPRTMRPSPSSREMKRH